MKHLTIYILPIAVLLLTLFSCEGPLDEEVYSQLAPGNFLATEEGVESTLGAAYAELALSGWQGKSVLNLESWCTDEEWQTNGGENRTAVLMIGFTWDASLGWARDNMWDRKYRSINYTNTVLDNIEEAPFNEDLVDQLRAEARFVRAVDYQLLYGWYGPVPLRTSAGGDLALPRANEEEMLSFIESEYLAAISDLPEPTDAKYGQGNKGAARAFLTKFYLNTKQWQKAANMALEVMNMGVYDLHPDYVDLFHISNESSNKEFIWAHQCYVGIAGNLYMNGALPRNPAYNFSINPNEPLVDGVENFGANWAANYRLYDEFVDSFDPADKRSNLILKEYIAKNGNRIVLRDVAPDNMRSFKYILDPDGATGANGNDIPEIRYADILLARAEALNEINSGPNAEAIELVNMIRNRAGLPELDAANFNYQSFKDHILNERRWEFFSERKRREDLIRHEKFISSALSRGKPAQAYHVRFPIPQEEMDANPNMVQNEGY